VRPGYFNKHSGLVQKSISHGQKKIYNIGPSSLLGAAFGFFCIPETKGKSLKDIEKHFSKVNLQELANPV
jgi:hypothetical protein